MANGLIEKAIETAVLAHWDQKSKGTDIPYVTHPIAVGLILARKGCPDELIAAGILHDTIEDTPLTFEALRARFGERVASIVRACSEPDRSLKWEERKAHTVEFLRTAPRDVKIVACADKLSNIRRIAADHAKVGESVWNRFRRGREKQEWYYRALAEVLCPAEGNGCDEPIFREYREEVERLFG